MNSTSVLIKVLLLAAFASIVFAPVAEAGKAEQTVLLNQGVEKQVTSIPLNCDYVVVTPKPDIKTLVLTIRELAMRLEANERLLLEVQEGTKVETNETKRPEVSTTSSPVTTVTIITVDAQKPCEKTKIAEQSIKNLNEPTLLELLETYEMTPEQRARYEDLRVMLDELKGPQNSALRSALFKFFFLAVAEPGNVAVQNQVGNFYYTVKTFSERQRALSDLYKRKNLKDKVALSKELTKQMKTLAWSTKILRNAKMYDQVSSCKGEHKEKVGTFMNSGSIEVLKYSLAHTSAAGKELKDRHDNYCKRLKNLGSVPECAKARLESLHKRAKQVAIAVSKRQKRCEQMASALNTWKPGESKWNEAYICAEKLQKQVQNMYRAFEVVEAELTKVEKLKVPVKIKAPVLMKGKPA